MNAPDRQTLRKTLAWCGRWLLDGFGQMHRDGLAIRIANKDGSEAVEVREGPIDNDRPPVLFQEAAEGGLMDYLVTAFLSEEEGRIVRLIAEAPRKASVLIERTKIERSRFYSLASNLNERGVIRTVSDGYELCDKRVLRVLGMAAEKAEEAEGDDR
jgi:hypothetical protein